MIYVTQLRNCIKTSGIIIQNIQCISTQTKHNLVFFIRFNMSQAIKISICNFLLYVFCRSREIRNQAALFINIQCIEM